MEYTFEGTLDLSKLLVNGVEVPVSLKIGDIDLASVALKMSGRVIPHPGIDWLISALPENVPLDPDADGDTWEGTPFEANGAAPSPVWRANSLNGYGAFEFRSATGSQLTRFDADLGGDVVQPCTHLMVAIATTNWWEAPDLFDGLNSGHRQSVYYSGSKVNIYAGGTPGVGPDTDGNWHTFGAVFNGASSSLWVDGVKVVTGNFGTDPIDYIRIGSGSNGGLSGKIAQYHFGGFALDDSTMTTQLAELAAKFDL